MNLINILMLLINVCGFLPYMIIPFCIISMLLVPYANRMRTAIYMFLLFNPIRASLEKGYRKGFLPLLPGWFVAYLPWVIPAIVFLGPIFLAALSWLYLKLIQFFPIPPQEDEEEQQPDEEPEPDDNEIQYDDGDNDNPPAISEQYRRVEEWTQNLRELHLLQENARKVGKWNIVDKLQLDIDEAYRNYPEDTIEKVLELRPSKDDTLGLKQILENNSTDVMQELVQKIRVLPDERANPSSDLVAFKEILEFNPPKIDNTIHVENIGVIKDHPRVNDTLQKNRIFLEHVKNTACVRYDTAKLHDHTILQLPTENIISSPVSNDSAPVA